MAPSVARPVPATNSRRVRSFVFDISALLLRIGGSLDFDAIAADRKARDTRLRVPGRARRGGATDLHSNRSHDNVRCTVCRPSHFVLTRR
jgi:hypothetical protein